jgi:transcriptional regulator with XRE-family HTH domain
MRRPRKVDPALVTVLCGFRAEARISQETLAYDADLTTSTLSRIERGMSNPTWGSIRAITGALGVSLEELVAAIRAYELEMTPAV